MSENLGGLSPMSPLVYPTVGWSIVSWLVAKTALEGTDGISRQTVA